jgi:hypothetical protein
VVPRAGLEGCGESHHHGDSIPGPSKSSESLYHLSFLGSLIKVNVKVKFTIVQALMLCTGRTVKCTVLQALRLCTGRTVKCTAVQALRLCTGRTVKCTLVQALRLCVGRTAHRGSRGIPLPFHDHSIRRGEGASLRPRPLITPRKVQVPIVQEAGWAPGPVWTGAENLEPTGIRSPDCPTRSQSL